MHRIDIIFMNNTVKVQTDPAVVNAGDEIMWHFVSTDPGIKWAEIDFPNGREFFRERGTGARTSKRGTDVIAGHGYLMGSSPDVPGKGVRHDKYTVRGSAGAGVAAAPPYTLDPDVITCDP